MWIYIANLVALSILMYVISEVFKVEGKAGYMYSIYPWVTTFPETFSTMLYAISGYSVAALYNSVFSALFDIAIVLGLVSIIHGRTEFRLRDLAIFSAFSGILFSILLYDGSIDIRDSMLLITMLMFVTIYSVSKYGWGVRAREFPKVVVGLVMLAIITYVFYANVEALIESGISEAYAGVLSSVLTSIPDLIVAIIYGIKSIESQAEILGCVSHDFIENVPISILVASLIKGSVISIVDPSPIVTSVIVLSTAVSLVFVSSFGRITRLEGFILLLLFIGLTFIVFL